MGDNSQEGTETEDSSEGALSHISFYLILDFVSFKILKEWQDMKSHDFKPSLRAVCHFLCIIFQ